MSRTKILIIGAGTQAKYIIDTVGYCNDKEIIGMVDVEENPEIHGQEIDGIKVMGYVDLEQLVNSLTVKEIEENIQEYEKLFILMKDYYRKVEKREDSFFK